jgi:hypothetical protein
MSDATTPQDDKAMSPASDGSQWFAYINKLQSIIERMNAVTLHQCSREYDGSPRRIAMHPLTCGNDSRHGVLMPWFDGRRIRLVCPDCDYTQSNSAMF